jgi:hypothetical protein
MMPMIHLEELCAKWYGGERGKRKRSAAGKTSDGTQGNLLYAKAKPQGKHQHAGVRMYGNVEHENTAIVCEISIKWRCGSLFCLGSREQRLPMPLKSTPLAGGP